MQPDIGVMSTPSCPLKLFLKALFLVHSMVVLDGFEKLMMLLWSSHTQGEPPVHVVSDRI